MRFQDCIDTWVEELSAIDVDNFSETIAEFERISDEINGAKLVLENLLSIDDDDDDVIEDPFNLFG